MTGRLLLVNAIAAFVYMTIWFFVAKARGRLDTVDTAWGSGFILAAWLVVLQHLSSRSVLIALLVSLWGGRLTWHIAQRSRTRKEDPRYETMSKKWKGNFWVRAYFSIFLLQGALVWVISLPIVFAAGTTVHGAWKAIFGTLIWLAGFVIETVADRQLAQFVRVAKNKGKVLDGGLWRYSRHPNYFGEITQWVGIGLIACSAKLGWIGLLGPLTLAYLIVFISGLPPIETRREGDAAYQVYRRRTSALIPWFPRKP